MSLAKRMLEDAEVRRVWTKVRKANDSKEFDIDVRGIIEMQEVLRIMDERALRRLTIAGLKHSGQIILKDLKARAPRDSGSMQDGIKMVAAKNSSGSASVIIRPHLGAKDKGKPYYAVWVEGGTADRRPKKRQIGDNSRGGKALYSTANGVGRYFTHAKGIKARPFVSESYNATNEKFVKDFEATFADVINEVITGE